MTFGGRKGLQVQVNTNWLGVKDVYTAAMR